MDNVGKSGNVIKPSLPVLSPNKRNCDIGKYDIHITLNKLRDPKPLDNMQMYATLKGNQAMGIKLKGLVAGTKLLY